MQCEGDQWVPKHPELPPRAVSDPSFRGVNEYGSYKSPLLHVPQVFESLQVIVVSIMMNYYCLRIIYSTSILSGHYHSIIPEGPGFEASLKQLHDREKFMVTWLLEFLHAAVLAFVNSLGVKPSRSRKCVSLFKLSESKEHNSMCSITVFLIVFTFTITPPLALCTVSGVCRICL